MKIQLIKAPTKNTGMPEHDWYTPLSLIWLANYISEYGYEVEILDGQLLSLKEILERISSDVVGISFDVLSTEEFDAIVLEAKTRGCFTVAGGHFATALGKSLLEGNLSLDAIVHYDGEEGLLGIIQSLEISGKLNDMLNNVIYRQNGGIIQTPVCDTDLNTLPLPRRNIGGLNLEDYFRNFQSTKHAMNLPFKYDRPTNSYSHKGCMFRQNGKGCSFCSRVDTHFRQKLPTKVYQEYKYLAEECGVDHISDFSDSWIVTPFVKGLAMEYDKHGTINASLRVYGDVRHVTPENAKIMREIGVETVLLGIESGNEDILRLNGKPISKKQILDTVKILAQNEIKIADAYVLGLIGETRESVHDTTTLAEEIKQLCETEISYWNIMTPLPGSRIWNELYSSGAISSRSKSFFDYHIDTQHLEEVAIQTLCKLGSYGYEFLKDIREKMLAKSLIASSEFVTAKTTTSMT